MHYPLFLPVSDYKRSDTSWFFIVTNLHTELKPQVKISHVINSLTLTLYAMFDEPWAIGKTCCFDQVRLKAQA